MTRSITIFTSTFALAAWQPLQAVLCVTEAQSAMNVPKMLN